MQCLAESNSLSVSVCVSTLLAAIGNAFAVLSCPEKRQRYDRFGTEEEQVPVTAQRHFYHNGGYEYDFTRGFEGEHRAFCGHSCYNVLIIAVHAQ